jgi:TfoX/Sxy family transcriptional regulator of competence genes
MAYSESLAGRVRQALGKRNIEEKRMMGGLTFMVNRKMCVGILGDDLMCRIDPEYHEKALKRKGCREMDFTGRPMRGFVFVGSAGTSSSRDLTYWVQLALAFNHKARPSRKRRSPGGAAHGSIQR